MAHRNGNHRAHHDRIATFEGRLAAGRATVAALHTIDPATLPVYFLDQLGAAAVDAHHLTHRFGDIASAVDPDRGWQDYCGPVPADYEDELDARIFAATAGSRLCTHLRRSGPQPAWARLGWSRIDCSRCIRTLLNPPSGEDDACDWCGRDGIDLFTPLAFQRGPLVVIGDACDACADALRPVVV